MWLGTQSDAQICPDTDLQLGFARSNCHWQVLIYLVFSEKKSSKRNIASRQQNKKLNMETTKNSFSAPKPSACTNVIQLRLRAFNRGFPVVFLSCFVFCFVLFFFLNLECAEIRWNIEKISVFFLFRSDQSKLYGEIQRHAIVIVYNYVYWQMIDITIVSCKAADSNMTQKYSITSSEDLESLKFPWKK